MPRILSCAYNNSSCLYDGGEKESGELESTPEGEAQGQVSLEEARNLASQYARDNREFYGLRYATQDLVWGVPS